MIKKKSLSIWRLPVVFAGTLIAGMATWGAVSNGSFFGNLVVFHGNTSCVGTLAPGEYQDVTVPDGQTCTINNSNVIDHDVTVGKGSTLNDVGSSIGHDLKPSHDSANIFIQGSTGYASGAATIGHDLDGDSIGQIQATNVNVGHDVQLNNLSGGGSSYFRNSCVGHDLQANNGQSSAGPLDISNNNAGCSSPGIGHDLQVQNNNQTVTVTNNTVGHDMQVNNNKPGGATVTGNTVGHDANCKANSPFAGSGNTAGHNNTCNGTGGGGGGPPPGNTNCTGALPPGNYNNVTVPNGSACSIGSGDNITGNLQVNPGASLTSTGANIGGSLQANQPASIQIDNTNVSKDLQVNGITGAGGSHICTTNVGGTLQVQNGQAGAGTFVIGDTSTGCSAGTNVTKDLTVQNNNNPVDASDNNVGGNLTVQNNSPGGATVNSNNVTKNATCKNNTPFTGSGNSAGGKNQGCG